MDLKTYLKSNRITQQQFADIVGCSQSSISSVIKGKSKFGPETAVEVAAATNYKVTPHELRPTIFIRPTDGIPEEHQNITKGI
ncbi:transcriptional regulator [Hafnia alvei]|uniref:transcriptional regulator n=1 Tax=Hafnia alvei TaxID=569 RepID=UPI00345E6924